MTVDATAPPPAQPPAAIGSRPVSDGGPGGTARFVTGEAVSLDLPVARLGSRMLARLIDLVVQVVAFWVLMTAAPIVLLLIGLTGLLEVDGALFSAMIVVVVAVVVLGYPVTLESLTGGRTLGKLALGLRVVRDDGGPIRFRQAMTRGLVSAAIEWPGLIAPPLTWLACLWTMVVSPQGKRLGDYAAGTVVIHERTPTVWGRLPFAPRGLAGWAATLDLAGLDDDLALAVRHFLARAPRLREPARTQLANRLMAEVVAVTRPGPPPGVPAWAYLAAVHAERHRRALHRLAAVRARSAAVWPDLAFAARPAPPTQRGWPGPAAPAAAPAPTVRSAVPAAPQPPAR